jgi:hypothetical protein
MFWSYTQVIVLVIFTGQGVLNKDPTLPFGYM